MRLESIEVANFRSLHHVKLEPLGNLVVLVGQNGAGKSNILEALELFFSDLNLQSDHQKQFDASTWYDRRTEKKIEFHVKLHLDRSELNRIIPDQLRNAIGIPDWPDNGADITIQRLIDTNLWKNVETRIGDVVVVKEGKVYAVGAKGEELLIRPEFTAPLLTNLNSSLKNQFRLVRGPRESVERPAPGIRPAVIDPETKQRLVTTANSGTRADDYAWLQFETNFREFSGRELRVRMQSLEFRTRSLTLPIEMAGSGDQALTIILRSVITDSGLIGIEEPETRLHHDYQRRLFALLKQVSQTRQIFLATHSPVFVDRDLFGDSWLVTLQGIDTKVAPIGRDQLKDVAFELGILPSDIFLSNAVMLVEGNTEKFALPRLASKLGVSLANISIIPTHGKSKQKYHLNVWSDATAAANVGLFALLDSDAEKEARELIAKRLIDRDQVHLVGRDSNKEPRAFEDFLPPNRLREVVEALIGDPMEKIEKDARTAVEKIGSVPATKALEAVFGDNPPKVRIALQTIDKSTEDELQESADELLRFLKLVSSRASPTPGRGP